MSKRASIFSKDVLHRHSRSRSDVAPPPPTSNETHNQSLDLTLGQEKAGGGSRGKNAKLGKLVVEREGLQMLDLTVAANMAVFLRVYERRSLGG
jgi:hypothetical protein